MTRARQSLLLLVALACCGCSTRAAYEGLRTSERLRQQRTVGAPERTVPDPGYDAYRDEQRRVEESAR